MISIMIDGCAVDILPFVSGLRAEADKVREAFGKYEAYGVSMGIEGIQAVEKRDEIDDDPTVSELDLVYADKMGAFGEVEMPSPAVCELVDLCRKNGISVIPLDMNDEEFTELYCDKVKAYEFVREHRLAKKGMKKKFDASTPEEFAVQWDAYVNEVKGFREVSEERERHIAEEITDVSKYRKSLLVLLEVERCGGVAALLGKR